MEIEADHLAVERRRQQHDGGPRHVILPVLVEDRGSGEFGRL